MAIQISNGQVDIFNASEISISSGFTDETEYCDIAIETEEGTVKISILGSKHMGLPIILHEG